jgi:hypothetical protein
MRTFLAISAFLGALALFCNAASAAATDAPPSNLAPTSAHLATILASHEAAIGKPIAGTSNTAIEDWRYTDSGISGTVHVERAASNYHSRITAGPLVEEFGQLNGARWHKDYNGFVSPTTEIDEETFYADYVNEDAADPKNDARVIGVTQGGHPAYVVQVKVSGASHPEWIFYDVANSMIVRVERLTHDGRRIVTTFDDFRTTGGITAAWHIHDAWNPREFDDDYVRTAMQVGAPVNAAQFAQPQSSSQLPAYTSMGFKLPVKIYTDGTIVVRMTIDGRGLDLMLDTIDNENVIDEDVAHQLGLPTYGHVDHLSDGTPVSFYTTIPTATIGTATYNNLVVDAMPDHFQQSWDTRVVGELGYDFLANNVFEIQYDVSGGSLTILPASTFDAADPVPGGISYPIDLDDGVPFIQVPIGNEVSKNVALALEFVQSALFGAWTSEHGDELTSNSKSGHGQADLPFANNGSFGQSVDVWLAAPTHVSFGSVNFQQPQILATNMPIDFTADRPVDAALGFDFLRWFDVYLDYPHNRIIVKPNSFFLKMVQHHG